MSTQSKAPTKTGLTYIEFRRWDAPEPENFILAVEWPAAPRVGETVMVGATCGEVRQVQWCEDGGLTVTVRIA